MHEDGPRRVDRRPRELEAGGSALGRTQLPDRERAEARRFVSARSRLGAHAYPLFVLEVDEDEEPDERELEEPEDEPGVVELGVEELGDVERTDSAAL